MKNSKFVKLCCGCMLGTLLLGHVPAAVGYADETEEKEITHGTATEWITEDMLNNTPPADYVVNNATQGKAENGDYSAYFLETEVQEVHITIDENNLNYLLQNAVDEPYVMTTSVTIGDATLGYCGLRTKGSYTLEHSYTENEGSDRFSFTINFGKYIKKSEYGKKQNFFGCDKISFNNFFFDKSMMKEFFALKLMDEMGLPTPEYGLAKLYINGNYYGVYAMVEAMDHSILERWYGVDKDELSSYLCKPEGTKFLYEEIEADPSLLWEQDEDTLKDVEDMIPTVTEWVRRINFLSNGMDFNGQPVDVDSEEYLALVDQVLDTDEVVKYFAVHSWLCQMDNMFDGQKNFGLYMGKDGRAVLIPWDYDLSFGCFYPSTAENTANYPLDVMYRMDYWRIDEIEKMSSEVYSQYPLFNIIYQSDALMEQYYAYMEECSKIVTLGGTVASGGKTYDPGYFNSFVEAMQEDIIAAATEKTADNVYYMNNIRQPGGVKKGLPVLSQIIAMRSVGVWNQVNEVYSTVCTYGCDLSALGNAMKGTYVKSGTLTSIDEATGIFVTADYEGGKNASAPVLSVEVLTETDVIYDMFKTELGCNEDDLLNVYKISNKGKAESTYLLTVPMTQAMLNAPGEFKFFTHVNGALQEFEMFAEDNLYTGEVEAIDYIVVAKGTDIELKVSDVTGETQEGTEPSEDGTEELPADESSHHTTIVWNLKLLIPVIAGAVVLAAAVIAIILVRKKKAKK